MIEPWPFQQRLIDDTKTALRSHRRVCLVSPTGSGKTVVAGLMAVRIARQLADAGAGSILFLVHRKELLKQTIRTMEKFGLGDSLGIIAAGWPGTPWAPIQIASVQTFVRRMDGLEWVKPKVLYVDEAHHIAANQWKRITAAYPKAYLIGMTATPTRLDEIGLGNFFDTLVQGPQMSELIPDYLCDIATYSVPPGFELSTKRDYTQQRLGEAQTGPIIAEAVSNWMRWANNRKTIFFCVDVKHSKRTVDKLRDHGVMAEHVDFKTPAKKRESVFRCFAEGDIQVMSNVELFTEGVDAPACNCVVLARPTTSLTLYKQMVGRVSRLKPDGGNGMVLDLANNVMLHGSPTADIQWELEFGVGKSQRKAIASKCRLCESCHYVYDKTEPACPLCGVKPLTRQVAEVNIELVPLDAKTMPAKPTKRQLSQRILQTGGDIRKLHSLAKEYGYSSGWAYKMKQMYGYGWGSK